MKSILLILLSIASLMAPEFLHAADCKPNFPLEPGKTLGWQGADDAYSIPLPGGRDVWIFGDTLYGPKRVVHGNTPRMVHSSIGISTCGPDGSWNLHYYIKHNTRGDAESFFVPKNPHHWYWAMDGFVAHHNLWITLLCIRPATHPEPWAMNFETCGSDLARIPNPQADPLDWKIEYYPLVPDGVKAYPSATTVVHGKYVYLFALYESGSRPLVATRIPLSGLRQPKQHLEYLTAKGQWEPGFDPAKAKHVMRTGQTELTIRYHPDLKKWLAVMVKPEVGFSDEVVLRSAPKLLGPWSGDIPIYRIPEMIPGPGRNKDVFCYAGKEHPEFESRGEIAFTYACNTMDVPALATDTSIYFPKFVTVPFPSQVETKNPR